MITKQSKSYECSLFVGGVEDYQGDPIEESALIAAVVEFQKTLRPSFPVRIAPMRIVHEDYNEPGWSIVAINYPRFAVTKPHLWQSMNDLAAFLLVRFKQNRITVMDKDATVLHERTAPGD